MPIPCFCGSLKAYRECCSLFIDDTWIPLSPEALMRSRYSAYAQAKMAYIVSTMCGPALEGFAVLTTEAWAKRVEWLRLIVIKARYSTRDSNQAIVEFKAYYREDGVEQCLHEKSLFLRFQGKWFYNSWVKPFH